jgi:GNAT superfamily N-acetyltransferase
MMLETWSADHLDEVIAIVESSFAERLTAPELADVCWRDDVPTVVLARRSELGNSVICVSAHGAAAAIDLVAVAPAMRRRGVGSELVRAAMVWAVDQGCSTINAGGHPPFYLWTGIDRTWIGALSLFERLGFSRTGCVVNLSCATDLAVPPPTGVALVCPDARQTVDALDRCSRTYPLWVRELERAIERQTATLSIDDATGLVSGFACHSVTRLGWFGPIAVFPDRSRPGTGAALLAAALGQLRTAGFDRCEISWVGPISFYAKVADATFGRLFLTHQLRIDSGVMDAVHTSETSNAS